MFFHSVVERSVDNYRRHHRRRCNYYYFSMNAGSSFITIFIYGYIHVGLIAV